MNRIIAFVALVITFPFLFLVGLAVKLTSKGPAIHWSSRVGRNNKLFNMPKFRSMYVDTPDVATHLLQDSKSHVTPLGKILRKTSIDELPQLWSIAKGDMDFVGPRPALHSQDDLVALRDQAGVSSLRPGVTGWAQVNGRDSISIPQKVSLDKYYLDNRSLFLDLKIIYRTLVKLKGDTDVSH